jgi:hypothetical protein
MFYLRWENSRRDKMSAGVGPTESQEKYPGGSQLELVDTTDLKNMGFRYVF